ncbi:TPA: YdcP family protein [Enterococcus faecium]
MRLAEGIIVDNEKTFGTLKFSALRREVFERGSDGEVTEQVKERTYDLKSSGQKQMIQVSLPADIPLKEFAYNEEVLLVEPIVDTVANPTFRGAEVDWYIKCANIVPAKKPATPSTKQANQKHT